MTIQDLENKYPKRDLPAGAEVLRVSPSPTGFVHLGMIYMANICRRVAENTKGVFILRIEDTDTARELVGAKELFVKMLDTFGITYDEGLMFNSGLTPNPLPKGVGENANALVQIGNYGPYIQSERKEIYDICIDYLLAVGRAYRCYMSVEELAQMREEQEKNKVRPGVYGQYAKWRPDFFDKEKNIIIEGNFKNNNLAYPLNADGSIDETSCIIRFLSLGNELNKFKFHDEFLGDMMVSENDEDLVIRKSDGLPTYHLAHIVDDHLMRTTFVLRGNEWWSSLGKHIEMWKAFDWSIPKYGHIVPINKQEESLTPTLSKGEGENTNTEFKTKLTVRKLSKRKDKEADVQFFLDEGYMPEAVMAYVTRLANPSFDDWMMTKIKTGEKLDLKEFNFNIKELARGGRGPLIDMNKLNNISSEYFSYLDNEELYEMIVSTPSASISLEQCPTLRPVPREGKNSLDASHFIEILEKNKDYTIKVFGIERRTKDNIPEKLRKDIYKLSQVKEQYYYFFDQLYNEKKNSLQYEVGYPFSPANAKELKSIFENKTLIPPPNPLPKGVGENTNSADIFSSEVTLEEWLAFMKEISIYLGYDKFANFMRDLRLALTLEERTPNLYDIMQVMGRERVLGRLG